MAKSREQKKEILKKLEDSLTRAKTIVFTRFNALKVDENEELRRNLKSENNEFYVAKKTLFNLAFKNFTAKDINIREFEGKISAVFGFGDEVSPIKIIDKFRKGREEKIEFIGGILENAYVSAKDLESLAKLPSRTELYAMLVGSLNAPVFGFANALAGNLRNLVHVLKAVGEKKSMN